MKDENLDKLSLQKITHIDIVSDKIKQNAAETTDVKQVIDLASTQQAIANESTVKKLIDEKTEELVNDAVRKKIEAETDKIRKEVDKVRAEADKEIAELEKSIANKKAEYEELVAQDRKADAFFNAHKSVLRYIGVKEKLSVRAMQIWLVPASIVYFIVQVLLFPLTLCGVTIETLMIIIGNVCEKISKNGLKITIAIIMLIAICGIVGFTYYAITHWLINIF